MELSALVGQRGVRYYSQFKPVEPCELLNGIIITPSGWQMLIPREGVSIRVCRSHFIGAAEWSNKELIKRFRDWLIYDSFVMETNGAAYFDENLLQIEEVNYSILKGSPGDEDDKYNAYDYTDITRFLVEEFTKPELLPSISYSNLYAKYCALSVEDKDLLEWYISTPPSPKRFDAFFGYYWSLFHLTVLIEKIVGLPPKCARFQTPCKDCGMTPPPHALKTRGTWLREELKNRIGDAAIAEQYATLIEAAKSVRDSMSHGPLFDHSSQPEMHFHGETFSYDANRASSEFREDINALIALLVSLRSIAHALIVDRVFATKHYHVQKPMKVTHITHSDRIL